MKRKQAEAIAMAVFDTPRKWTQRAPFWERFLSLVLVLAAGATVGAVLAKVSGGIAPVWAFVGVLLSAVLLFVVRTVMAARRHE